jgi:hypothetical protein
MWTFYFSPFQLISYGPGDLLAADQFQIYLTDTGLQVDAQCYL